MNNCVRISIEEYKDLIETKTQFETVLMMFAKLESWRFDDAMLSIGYVSKNKADELVKKIDDIAKEAIESAVEGLTQDDVNCIESEV